MTYDAARRMTEDAQIGDTEIHHQHIADSQSGSGPRLTATDNDIPKDMRGSVLAGDRDSAATNNDMSAGIQTQAKQVLSVSIRSMYMYIHH